MPQGSGVFGSLFVVMGEPGRMEAPSGVKKKIGPDIIQ